MKRLLALIPLIAALLIPAHSQAADAPKVIKATTHSAMDGSLCRSFQAMKKYIEDKTDGRYRMDIYDSFKLGTMEEAYQGMGLGTVQFLAEGPSNISTFMPALTMFDLAFIFPNSEVADEVLSGPMGKKILDAAKNKSVTPLAFTRYASRSPFVTGDINSTADLKGTKIRASSSPLHIAVLKAMGMNPTPMPGSEVYTGLQQGVIDGFDVDFPFGYNSKWYEAAKSVAVLNHSYVPQILFTSTKWWDSLPAEDKPIFEEAVQVFIDAQRKNQLEDEKRALEGIEKAGIKLYTPTPEEMAALVQSTEDLYKQFPKVDQELYKELKEAVSAAANM